MPTLPPVDYEVADEVEQDLKPKKAKKAKKDKRERRDEVDEALPEERKPLDDLELARIVVGEEAERERKKKKKARKEARRRMEAAAADEMDNVNDRRGMKSQR